MHTEQIYSQYLLSADSEGARSKTAEVASAEVIRADVFSPYGFVDVFSSFVSRLRNSLIVSFTTEHSSSRPSVLRVLSSFVRFVVVTSSPLQGFRFGRSNRLVFLRSAFKWLRMTGGEPTRLRYESVASETFRRLRE